MTNKHKAILAIILSAVFGGGNAVFNKLGLKEISPLLFIFLRFSLSSVVLIPFLFREKVKFDKNLFKLILISLFAVSNIFLFTYGVRQTSANIATILYTCTPIIIAVLSYFINKERITLKKIIGIIMGFLGTMFVILLPILENKTRIQGNLMGNIIIFMGVLFFSIYGVYSKKLQKNYSPKFVSMVFFLCTIVISLPFAVWEMIQKPMWWQVSNEAWLGLLYVGIFGAIGLYILFQYAIKYGSPLFASLNSYLQPIMGVIWAATLLGEKITMGFIVGAVMTLFGVWLVTRS